MSFFQYVQDPDSLSRASPPIAVPSYHRDRTRPLCYVSRAMDAEKRTDLRTAVVTL